MLPLAAQAPGQAGPEKASGLPPAQPTRARSALDRAHAESGGAYATLFVYILLRVGSLVLLVGGAILLAAFLGVTQYGIYAQGAAFASVVYVVGHFGQDQLLLRGDLTVTALRARSLAVASVAVTVSCLGAVLVLPQDAVGVALANCLGAGATVVASGYWLAAQAGFKDRRRGLLELVQRSLVQGSAVMPAGLGGGALSAAVGSGVIATLSTAPVWSQRKQRRVPVAPFRAGLLLGLSGVLHGALPALIGLVIAMTASAEVNAQVRLVLLGYVGLTAVSVAVNDEFFRRRLYGHADSSRKLVIHKMFRADAFLAAVMCVGLPLAGLVVLNPILPGFREAGNGIALLAIVVPIHFASSALGNILFTSWPRTTIGRHLLTALVGVSAVLLSSETVTGAVMGLTAGEVAGFAYYLATPQNRRKI